MKDAHLNKSSLDPTILVYGMQCFANDAVISLQSCDEARDASNQAPRSSRSSPMRNHSTADFVRRRGSPYE